MSVGTSTVTTTPTSGPSELPVMAIGESFVGEGADAAHLNTVLGRRAGPVGTAWATALATPRAGRTPFIAVVKPGLPAKPITLFVNKAPIASSQHGDLTWGAAQAGVAAGVCDAVAAGVIDASGCHDLVLIAAVWVNPDASEAELVYQNNRAATLAALRAGAANLPQLSEVLPASAQPVNPYFCASAPPPAAG
ncbi:MAG TPA: formaldehyde-activating enzyme [Streptosporangiaceae bacterium]|jgi:5,6,7,8-tetrahydromethanopterin hydro-lyase|nr:formaldehyde-activating enzyme [Streptosporangiaceae bacterium]